jgi:hypothetical protein
MPMSFTHLSLRRRGFDGFVSVADLRADHCRAVPERGDGRSLGGVYVALCLPTSAPRFKRSNRREEWTLPLAALRERWVGASPVVYIGKAHATDRGNSIRKRLSRYLRASTSHTGGKRTWQLADWDQLTIAWRILDPADDPRTEEVALLDEHNARFGRQPFANG